MLQIRDLRVAFQGFHALKGVGFHVEPGQWLMVFGPNGAGKSTLLNAVSQVVPYQGKVILNGMDARRMKPKAFARKAAVLRQSQSVGYAFTVEQLVALGRYAHQGAFSAGDEQGQQKVEEALSLCGLEERRHQNVLTLSGGELQRAFLAQVFAQDAPLLLLDEPTSHLDLKYQRDIFEIIAAWLKAPGRAVLSVVHDLPLARRYGTHGVLLQNGVVVASGTMQKVIAKENLVTAYGMDVNRWFDALYQPWLAEKITANGQTGGNPL
jgi:iron complex transport system ATP-binding protein